eukprot:31175-Pelagococcus_subviridis.AAC.3
MPRRLREEHLEVRQLAGDVHVELVVLLRRQRDRCRRPVDARVGVGESRDGRTSETGCRASSERRSVEIEIEISRARSAAKTRARTHQRALHVERVLLHLALRVCEDERTGAGVSGRARANVLARGDSTSASREEKRSRATRRPGDAREIAPARDANAPASHLSCSGSCARAAMAFAANPRASSRPVRAKSADEMTSR